MNRIYILLLLLLILATITSCENNTPPKENQITSDSSTTAISTLSNVIDTALPIVDSPSTSELNIPKKTPIPPNPSHSDHKPSSENNNNDNDNISSSTTGDYAWLSNYNSSNSLQKQIPHFIAVYSKLGAIKKVTLASFKSSRPSKRCAATAAELFNRS